MRWLTLWGTLVAICFGAVCSAALYDSRRDAIASARQATTNLGLLAAANVAHDIELLDISLQALAFKQSKAELASLDAARRYLTLFDRIPAAKGMGVLTVLDRNGKLVDDSAPRRLNGLDFSDRDYFRAHLTGDTPGLFISAPFISLMTERWTIAISRRITLADGSFGGVALGLVRVAHLEGLIGQIDLGTNGSVTLFRSDGIVLARAPIRSNVPGSGAAQSALFKQYQENGSGHFETVSVSDGMARLYAFNGVARLPMFVAVGMAKDNIYANWYHKSVIIGLTMLASCMAMVGLVWMLRYEFRRRVAAERVASRNESRYRLLAENSADTIAMSDASGRVSYISPAIQDVLGWTPADIEGRALHDFVHPDHLSVIEADDYASASPRTLTFPARHCNGTWVWLEARVRKLTSDLGDASYISNIRDFSSRKKAEEELEAANAELEAIAATDSLTGLANRRCFDESLDREWRRALRDQSQLALLLIDADHFKALNDHYGHQQGDRYLRAVAHVIDSCIRRTGDISARYGGEEFAILLPNTDTDGAHAIAEKIRLAVLAAQIPHVKSAEGVMTVSIGVFSQMPTEALTAAGLVKRADAALYAAKRNGRNRTSVFCEDDAFALPTA